MGTLTDEQQEIIRTRAHRVQVFAYAGTAKTTVLCKRVEHLLHKGVNPQGILILAFSNATVSTLCNRLGRTLNIETCHAFGLQLLSSNLAACGLKRCPELLSPASRLALLSAAAKTVLKTRNIDRTWLRGVLIDKTPLGLVSEFFTLVSATGGKAKALVEEEGSVYGEFATHLRVLGAVYAEYKRLKLAKSVIDYGDMVRHATRLLDAIDLRVTYLFVDEFQDCNHEQVMLIRALALRVPNVMVFGDRFQTIYGFAGARHYELSRLVPGVKTFSLTRSFRLTGPNAALASAIISANTQHQANLIGARGKGYSPILVRCASADEQARAVARTVRQLVDRKVEMDRIAILARTRAQVRYIEQFLRAKNAETNPLYRKQDAEHAVWVLRLVQIVEIAAAKGWDAAQSRWDALFDRVAASDLSERERKKTQCAKRLREALRIPSLDGRYSACASVYFILLGGKRNLDKDSEADVNRWRPKSREFASAAQMAAAVKKLSATPKITTSTIHGAKGLEWDHVLVLDVTDGSIPFYRAKSERACREELNLLYVAVTRAKRRVILFHAPYTNAQSRQRFEGLSSFVDHPGVLKVLVRTKPVNPLGLHGRRSGRGRSFVQAQGPALIVGRDSEHKRAVAH